MKYSGTSQSESPTGQIMYLYCVRTDEKNSDLPEVRAWCECTKCARESAIIIINNSIIIVVVVVIIILIIIILIIITITITITIHIRTLQEESYAYV